MSLAQILPSLKIGNRIAVMFENETHAGFVQALGDGYIEVIMEIDGEETYAELYEDNYDYKIEIIG